MQFLIRSSDPAVILSVFFFVLFGCCFVMFSFLNKAMIIKNVTGVCLHLRKPVIFIISAGNRH